MLGDIHRDFAWVAISLSGLVGLWGVVLGIRRSAPPRLFWRAIGVATVAMLVQVAMGVYAFAVEKTAPGNQHVFYGVVVAFSFAFAYIYRTQLRKRPALYWGLFMLFVMGLGIRGLLVFGGNF